MEKHERIGATSIFFIVIILLGFDIADDMAHGSEISHVIQEATIVLLGLLGIIILWVRYFSIKKDLGKLSLDLTKAKQDLTKFKSETKALSEGFSQKIDDQLSDWSLTSSEKEVALLMLKGLGHKEIAHIRNSSEKTVRTQATAIYQKSNLSGRNELAAFFLEDLLILPNTDN